MQRRRFNDEEVRQLRKEYRTPCPECGHMPTYKELAKKHGGVSYVAVGNAITSKGSYFWVEDD